MRAMAADRFALMIGAACIVGAMFSSCASTNGGAADSTWAGRDGTNRLMRAVCIGAEEIRRGGRTVQCPGAGVDAWAWAEQAAQVGIESRTYLNTRATWGRIEDAIRSATADMDQPTDMLMVTYSGHGGQVADRNGDEGDGMDETLCLRLEDVSDDRIYETLQTLPAIRVVMIADSCNSGTVARRVRPLVFARRGDLRCQVILLSGTADGTSAWGSEQGGCFTTALLDQLRLSRRAWPTYRTWINGAKEELVGVQVPQYHEYGNVTDDFRNSPAMR